MDIWPRDYLDPRDCQADPAYRTTSGGVALSGYEQVSSSDAGVWVVSYSNFPIPDGNKVLAWRAISDSFEGRANAVAIPIYEERRAPVPAGTDVEALLVSSYRGVPHSDGSFFSDTSGYATPPIDVRTTSALRRATTVTMTKIMCGEIRRGHRFSVNHRLYQIGKVETQTPTLITCKIWPPLRDAWIADSFCNFFRPTLKARLASDREMDLPLEYNRWGFPSVSFIEETL